MPLASARAIKMCSLLKYSIEIITTVCSVSLALGSGTKHTQDIIPTIRRLSNLTFDVLTRRKGDLILTRRFARSCYIMKHRTLIIYIKMYATLQVVAPWKQHPNNSRQQFANHKKTPYLNLRRVLS